MIGGFDCFGESECVSGWNDALSQAGIVDSIRKYKTEETQIALQDTHKHTAMDILGDIHTNGIHFTNQVNQHHYQVNQYQHNVH